MPVSPTYIQDQQILWFFNSMPEGQRYRFRQDFFVEMNRQRVAHGYSEISQERWEIVRYGDQLLLIDTTGQAFAGEREILRLSSLAEGQSVALAFAFTFALAFAFAFGSVALALALTFAFAFEPVGAAQSTPEINWNALQQHQAAGASAGFGFVRDQNRLAGRATADGRVEMLLQVDEEKAAQILALLRR